MQICAQGQATVMYHKKAAADCWPPCKLLNAEATTVKAALSGPTHSPQAQELVVLRDDGGSRLGEVECEGDLVDAQVVVVEHEAVRQALLVTEDAPAQPRVDQPEPGSRSTTRLTNV